MDSDSERSHASDLRRETSMTTRLRDCVALSGSASPGVRGREEAAGRSLNVEGSAVTRASGCTTPWTSGDSRLARTADAASVRRISVPASAALAPSPGPGEDRPMTSSPTATQTLAFAVPILPGKTDADRAAMESCRSGERQADHAASRARAGITRESVWIQSTPGGDVAVVVLEGDDIGAAMGTLATSQEPFDTWFREVLKDVHGIDPSEGFPPPEQVMDYRA